MIEQEGRRPPERRKRLGIAKELLAVLFYLIAFSSALGQEEGDEEPRSPWWRQVPVAGQDKDKSPFWAGFSSVLLPGGGQFYSENELRGLLFFFTQGSLLGMTLYEHVKTEDAWRRYENGGNREAYEDYSYHFDRRYNLLWWDAAVWFLSVADAYVDAHMYRFKEGGRMALVVQPKEERGLELRLTLGL